MRRKYIWLVAAAVLLIGGYIAYRASIDPDFFKPRMRVSKVRSNGSNTLYEVTLPKKDDLVYNTGIWIAPSRKVRIWTIKDTTAQPFDAVLKDEVFESKFEETQTYDEWKKEVENADIPDDLKKMQLGWIEELKDESQNRMQLFSMNILTFKNSRFQRLSGEESMWLTEAAELYLRVSPKANADSLNLYIDVGDNDLEKVWETYDVPGHPEWLNKAAERFKKNRKK
jgi:hypothetical protein